MSQQTIVRFPQVIARIGISRSSLYAFIKAGTFPPPMSLGARAVGVLSADVDEWINTRPQASRLSFK